MDAMTSIVVLHCVLLRLCEPMLGYLENAALAVESRGLAVEAFAVSVGVRIRSTAHVCRNTSDHPFHLYAFT